MNMFGKRDNSDMPGTRHGWNMFRLLQMRNRPGLDHKSSKFDPAHHDNEHHIFRYSELVFPKKIIINFVITSAIAIYVFFYIAFLIQGWTIKRNEKIFNQHQSLQVFLAKQGIEESIYEIFYTFKTAQDYFNDDLLPLGKNHEKNRIFQFVQSSKQEILGFLISYSDGSIDYSNLSTGETDDVAKSVGSTWLKEYWKTLGTSSRDPMSVYLYVSHNYQFIGNIIPVKERGRVAGLLCIVIDLKPIINRYVFPMGMDEYGTGSLLTGDGLILFDEDSANIGKNIFTIDKIDTEIVKTFSNDVLGEPVGTGHFRFVDSEGRPQKRLAAWHSLNIGRQKLILLLTATEKQVNSALFDFQTQLMILGFSLMSILIIISFVLIASRKKIVQENARQLEILIRQRTEELALSETRYQAVFQTANDVILIIKENKIVNFNNKALKTFGYTEEELKKLSPGDISEKEFEKDSEQLFTDYMEEVKKGIPQFFEWKNSRKDGSSFYSEISLSNLDLGEEHYLLAIIRDITERKKAQTELEKLNAELELRVFLRTGELEDSNNALKDSLIKLKETQKSLVEAEKMASLAVLVAGVAHEINTPIGISVTAASYLKQQTDILNTKFAQGTMKRSELESYINSAIESAKVLLDNVEKASDHISSFKKVAVDQASQEKRTFNLKGYMNEILLSLMPAFKKTKHKVTVIGQDDINIESMPGALSQIVTNLVMNSLKHGFEGIESGEIKIELDIDKDIAIFRYSDNGVGMDEATKSRLFDPFFTTKRGSGGSGLGMHIVYNLVTQSLKGTIIFETSPGNGLFFEIKWPVGTK
ncbi:MAG: PAS domain S-box protein [Spirochaetaceae bacterium]|nr:PAS domain S-box protein [Spirochaetaceae bacterium]